MLNLSTDTYTYIYIGDFSFSRSLVVQYGCRNVLATCYDSEGALHEKYPQAEGNVNDILDNNNNTQKNNEDDSQTDDIHDENEETNRIVLYSVDARKLGMVGGGGKMVRKGFRSSQSQRGGGGKAENSGPWDVICFNFPHVGGLSTDVNRQVRSNQELLVAFFKACIPLLSASSSTSDEPEHEHEEEEESDNGRRTHGQILVTLFESEPYTLWNIKDLARHAGLRVITSFRFPWSSYHGYSHARTLGQIESKHGGGKGGWKGEDRLARMYVFDNVARASPSLTDGKPGGKRKRRSSSDSSDSE